MASKRLGVIGAGLIWMRVHQPILATMTDVFEPVAFADTDPQRRDRAARAFPHAQVVSDFRSLLALPEVEAVLVLTPIALNAPVALAALRAGKDVIMEKPIARSVAEGRALLAEARRSGRQLFVTEQIAYRQEEQLLAHLLASGAIGEPITWQRVLHLDGDTAQGALRYDTTPWRKNPDFPLGTLFDGGVHLIASLSQVFGPPVAVAATGRHLRPEYGPYDQVTVLFQYYSGLNGALSHSTYLPPLHNHFRIYGTTGAISVEAQQITLHAPGQPEQNIARPSENSYLRMWQALAGAVRTGSPPCYAAEHALRDVAILEAIDRSIAARTWTPVETIEQA